MKKVFLAALLLVSVQANAAQWMGDFQITNLYISLPENFHYRIYGMPAVADCNNGSTWAYVNESDPGSKGKIAAILMAYASGRPVRVLVEPTNGFCHIIEMFVS